MSEYDQVQYEEMYDTFCDEFKVSTLHQRILVEELCSTYIKLSRSAKYTKEVIEEDLHTDGTIFELIGNDVEDGYKAQLGESTMYKLEAVTTRYEAQLGSRLLKLIAALKTLSESN